MKTISMTLDVASIDRAIAELQKYQTEFQEKVRRLREMIGERVAWSASRGFNSALVEDVIYGPEQMANVSVTVEHPFKNLTVVLADGPDAVFIEFGAGVYNNGAAGTSPHPWGAQRGYLIGEYGKGRGKRKAWGYYDANDEKVLTHGTPAAMPMYHGLQDAIRVIDHLVREVFGDD